MLQDGDKNSNNASGLVSAFHKNKRYLPNLLTLSRFLLVPFLVVILIPPVHQLTNLIAAIIFIVASLTDWLDGYLARAFKAETIIGTMMDTLADKILVLAVLIMLSAGADPRVPAWIAVVLISREVIITGLRSLAALKGIVVSPIKLGKYKTASTMLAIVFLLIDHTYSYFGITIVFREVGNYVLWVALALSLISAVQYFIDLRSLFNEEEQ